MEVSVIALAQSIYSIGTEISSINKTVLFNKAACNTLSQRVEAVQNPVQHLKDDHVYRKSLREVESVLQEAKVFMTKSVEKKDSKKEKVLHMIGLIRSRRADCEKFVYLNSTLSRACQDLCLGVQVSAADRASEDCKDSKRDRDDILEKINEMVEEVEDNNGLLDDLLDDLKSAAKDFKEMFSRWDEMDKKLIIVQEHLTNFPTKQDTKAIQNELIQLRTEIEDFALQAGSTPQQDYRLNEIGKSFDINDAKISSDVKKELSGDFDKLQRCIDSLGERQQSKYAEIIGLIQELMINTSQDSTDLRQLYLQPLMEKDNDVTLEETDTYLGNGTFGTVSVGYYGNKEVAVKEIENNNAKSMKRMIENEVLLLNLCKGTHVPEVYKLFHHKNSSFVVMELASRGTLSHLLLDEVCHVRVPLSLMIWWMHDIAAALVHIHSRKVVHYDIKPENILLVDNCRCKLTDFGLAQQQKTSSFRQSSSEGGTLPFMAPELKNNKGGNHRSDVYSLGITSLVILKGKIPRVQDSVKEFASSAVSTCFLPEWGKTMTEYFAGVLQQEMEHRSSARDALLILDRIGQKFGDPRHLFSGHQDREKAKTIDALAHGLLEKSAKSSAPVTTNTKKDNIENVNLRADEARHHSSIYFGTVKLYVIVLVLLISTLLIYNVNRLTLRGGDNILEMLNVTRGLLWNRKKKAYDMFEGKQKSNISFLVDTVRDGTADSKTKAAAAFWTLALNDENKVKIASEGSIGPLIALVRDGTDEGKTKAAGALWSLALNDDNKVTITNEGGIGSLVALTVNGTSEGKTNAAGALYNLASIEDNRVKMANEGGIRPLIALVRDGTAEGKTNAAGALYNLASIEDNRVKIANEGGIRPLIALAVDGTAEGKVSATGALWRLSNNYDIKIRISDEGGSSIL